jgi:hypothetical protein
MGAWAAETRDAAPEGALVAAAFPCGDRGVNGGQLGNGTGMDCRGMVALAFLLVLVTASIAQDTHPAGRITTTFYQAQGAAQRSKAAAAMPDVTTGMYRVEIDRAPVAQQPAKSHAAPLNPHSLSHGCLRGSGRPPAAGNSVKWDGPRGRSATRYGVPRGRLSFVKLSIPSVRNRLVIHLSQLVAAVAARPQILGRLHT